MNPMRYKNEKHKNAFEEAVRKKDKKDYAMMAALYLLTADLRLWNLSKRHVGKIGINFADIRLKNIHENGYALFCCAKDLCLGTKHLTVADLADTDLIPPKLFELICNAMAIRRFGLGAIKTTKGRIINVQSNRAIQRPPGRHPLPMLGKHTPVGAHGDTRR